MTPPAARDPEVPGMRGPGSKGLLRAVLQPLSLKYQANAPSSSESLPWKRWRWRDSEHPFSYTWVQAASLFPQPSILEPVYQQAPLHWPRVTVYLHFPERVPRIWANAFTTHACSFPDPSDQGCLSVLYNQWARCSGKVLTEWILSFLLKFMSIRWELSIFRYFVFLSTVI